MRERENRLDNDPGPLAEGRIRDLSGQSPLPRPPLRFVVKDEGSGVRVTIVNDGLLGGRLNGATRYDVYFAAKVDTSTAAGKAAGFARATCLAPSIPATGIDHTESSAFYADPKYAAGYFYCVGVDKDGNRSEPTEPAPVVSGAVDHTIPGDVQHFQISESGKESNGTVMSELSVTCDPPVSTANFAGVQLYLQHYLAIDDIQAGAFHKWNGSGAINFAPLYPIPRRRSSVSVTATNGSPNVTAASGLLRVARAGELFELLGASIAINTVTDTQITLASNWPKDTVSSDQYVIIGKPTIYGVSISKAGTRRDDVENAPSQAVLMDGELSAPNTPSVPTLASVMTAVRVSWDQLASSSIAYYTVYRSDGISTDSGMASSPPRPAATTVQLDRVPHNPNLSTGATAQLDDSNFTKYELETNASFRWYVTATNTRGKESAASSQTGYCRTIGPHEIDPAIPGRNHGKNYLYNAQLFGSAAANVASSDTTQDNYMGTDASNLPGQPFGGTVPGNGTGRFRGYTRWHHNDGGSGAGGSIKFLGLDSVEITAPGDENVWHLYQEIGAWDAGTTPYMKLEDGGTYTVSVFLAHNGVAPVGGSIYFYLQQYNDGTSVGYAKRRYRDSNGEIQTSATGLEVALSDITVTPTRYQAAFTLDTNLSPSKQVRVAFAWNSGTAGSIVLARPMLSYGEVAPEWTADMGDTNISVPAPAAPTGPVGDGETERIGDARVIVRAP